METQVWNGIRDFSAGYVDKVGDHLLPDNASPDCQNVLATAVGTLHKRKGQERYGGTFSALPVRGVHAYYRGADRHLIVAAGDTVFRRDNSTGNYHSLRTGLSTTAPTTFATTVHLLVAFNGVNPPWRWDGTTTGVLANAPVDGRFALLHKEKLFTVPLSAPSTLRWSESFLPEIWPAVNFWDVGLGDGDEITNIFEYAGDMLVFKRRSMHVLSGTDLADFRLRNVSASMGCVGEFAAATIEPNLYFISDDGLCVWNGMAVTNLSDAKIPHLWSTINRAHIHKAAVGTWNDFVWFAVPTGDSTHNNLVILCKQEGREVVFWPLRGINAACFQRFDDGNGVQFYTGDAVAGWVNQQDVGWTDFRTPINAYWQSKAFAVDSPEYKKKFKEMRVVDSPNAADVVLMASVDYAPSLFLQPAGGDTLVRRFIFPSGTYGRYLAARITHAGFGDVEVRGLTALYQRKVRMI